MADLAAGTRTFSGTPAAGDIGTVSVKVTASDGTDSASDTFDIVVAAPPPPPPDTTPPRVSGTPAVNGVTLTIVFNERLAGGAVPPAAFEVVVGGGAGVTPSAVEVDHDATRGTVTLTLPAAVAHGQTVEVRYTRPAVHGERLRDVAGNAVADFTLTVTNTAPAPGSPVADAGSDLTVDPGASVTLDGSASADPDGDALAWAWTQTAGATVALEGADTAAPAFTALAAAADLWFRLTVTDPGGLSASDAVTVTVRDAPPRFAASAPALTLVLDREMAPVALPEAEGGNGGPYTYALTSAPAGLAGLSFDAASRTLSGTPAGTGDWTFTWRADDADDNRTDADAAVLSFRVSVRTTAPEAQRRAVKRTMAAVAQRTMAAALDTIGARLGDGVPGASLTLAGESVPIAGTAAAAGWRAGAACPADGFGQAGFGAAGDGCAPAGWSRTVGTAELLDTSAFSLPLGAAASVSSGRDARRRVSGDAAPSRTSDEPTARIGKPAGEPSGAPLWSVWGRGDLGTFAGRPEPGLRYEGALSTGWLGVDARLGAWVAGLAVSHGTSGADYRFDGAGGGRGRLETTLTALYHYWRWNVVDGLELRGGLGGGLGEARHRLDGGERETSDLSMRMASASLRQALPLAPAGIALGVRADASLARMESGDGPDHMDGLTADGWRARLGLEASRRFALSDDTALVASVEAAGRYDGGDGLIGTGLEVAGALGFTAPWLHLQARGRWLAAHSEEGARESGVSATARVGPGVQGHGLSLSVSPRWGAGTGGAQALWHDEMPKPAGASAGEAAALDAQIAYGVGVAPHGLLTPFAEAGLAGADSRRLRIGARFDASHVNLGAEVAGERVESAAAAPEHALSLDLRLRF